MVYRVYVEKKQGQTVDADSLLKEVKEFLQMQFTEKSRVTLLNTYFEELAGAVDYRKWYFGSLHMDKHISATQVAVFTNVLEAWTGKPI